MRKKKTTKSKTTAKKRTTRIRAVRVVGKNVNTRYAGKIKVGVYVYKLKARKK